MPVNLSPLQLPGTIIMPPQYKGIDYAVAVASQFGRVFTSTLVNMHRLLPMLAGQIWYNFPPLLYHAIMLYAVTCHHTSPSLGPAAVLSRNETVPNHTGQARRQNVAQHACPDVGWAMLPVLGPSVQRYPECAKCSTKLLVVAPTNMPPLYKQSIPFTPTSCVNLVTSHFCKMAKLHYITVKFDMWC